MCQKNAPRVSVLIPCYNAGAYLGQAIQSVLDQTYRDFEIIVVDDGSTDDSAAVAQSFDRVRYFYNEHSGISVSRNLAIAKARGEIIVFLDADDLWHPEKLQKQVDYLDADPACMLVFTKVENFFEDEAAQKGERQQELYHADISMCIISCAIRRSVFEEHGVFREDYPHGEDTQFMYRLSLSGIDLKHSIDEVLYRRRVHSTNISLTHENNAGKKLMAIMADALREVRRRKKEKGSC